MMDDREFDRILEEEMTDLPLPERTVAQVTPWKRAMSRVVWGLALTTVKLEFWNLNYLLPAIGMVMLFLGFGVLRRENKWFRFCWLVSLLRAALEFRALVLNATIQYSTGEAHGWLLAVSILVPLSQYIALWQGIRAVRRRAGQPDQAGAAGALAVWYGILCALALMGMGRGLVAWVVILAYGFILRGLYKVSALLDGAGYEVEAAPLGLSDKMVWRLWFGGLTVCCLLAWLAFGRYPMDWQPRPVNEQAGLEEIREHLLDLGVPEGVINDLSPQELAYCEEAVYVTVEVEEESPRYGWEEQPELILTNVALELPGKRWQFIHHFQWRRGPEGRATGTECVQIWPTYRASEWDECRPGREMSGRLLVDREDGVYVADYYSLGPEVTQASFPGQGVRSGEDWYGAFSWPTVGENCRGYVTYDTTVITDDIRLVDSWINYVHQMSWIQYPKTTALDFRMSGGSGGTFKKVQGQLMACVDPDFREEWEEEYEK